MECYTIGSPRVGDQDWVDHFNSFVHSSWRFQKEMDGLVDLVVWDVLYRHVKGVSSCPKDLRTNLDFFTAVCSNAWGSDMAGARYRRSHATWHPRFFKTELRGWQTSDGMESK